ncbi:MAG: hypothetical protein OXI43_13420 [Candidatus Poribacteria bacterium]|nr:hypothetical protein [Candidatus Poribacteria bacterium]
MTEKYAILYALRDGLPIEYCDLAIKTAELLGLPKESGQRPKESERRGGYPYFTWSRILTTYWRDEKGFVENSKINANLPPKHWQITQAGLDYLKRNL